LVKVEGAALGPLRGSLRNLTISHNAVPLIVDADALVGFSLAAVRVRSSGLRSLEFIEDVAAVELLDVGGNEELGAELTLAWSAALALQCRETRLDAIGAYNHDNIMN